MSLPNRASRSAGSPKRWGRSLGDDRLRRQKGDGLLGPLRLQITASTVFRFWRFEERTHSGTLPRAAFRGRLKAPRRMPHAVVGRRPVLLQSVGQLAIFQVISARVDEMTDKTSDAFCIGELFIDRIFLERIWNRRIQMFVVLF